MMIIETNNNNNNNNNNSVNTNSSNSNIFVFNSIYKLLSNENLRLSIVNFFIGVCTKKVISISYL